MGGTGHLALLFVMWVGPRMFLSPAEKSVVHRGCLKWRRKLMTAHAAATTANTPTSVAPTETPISCIVDSPVSNMNQYRMRSHSMLLRAEVAIADCNKCLSMKLCVKTSLQTGRDALTQACS